MFVWSVYAAGLLKKERRREVPPPLTQGPKTFRELRIHGYIHYILYTTYTVRFSLLRINSLKGGGGAFFSPVHRFNVSIKTRAFLWSYDVVRIVEDVNQNQGEI